LEGSKIPQPLRMVKQPAKNVKISRSTGPDENVTGPQWSDAGSGVARIGLTCDELRGRDQKKRKPIDQTGTTKRKREHTVPV